MRALLLMVTGLGSLCMTTTGLFFFMTQMGRSFDYAFIVTIILMLPQVLAISLGVCYLEDKQKEKRKTP